MGLYEYIQMPYYCDDCNSWHITLYDEVSDGDDQGIWEGDMDGNWDISMDEKLPSDTEYINAWNAYSKWVVSTGLDPLSEFSRAETKKMPENWTFRIHETPIGLMVVSGRKAGGKNIEPATKLPEYVREYLTLDPENELLSVISDFKTVKELSESLVKSDSIKKWPRSAKEDYGYYLLSCVIDRPVIVVTTKKQIVEAARKNIKVNGYAQ